MAEQLLLGYLPTDRGLWSSELIKKRSQYKHFKEELLMNPVSHAWYFNASICSFIMLIVILEKKILKVLKYLELLMVQKVCVGFMPQYIRTSLLLRN